MLIPSRARWRPTQQLWRHGCLAAKEVENHACRAIQLCSWTKQSCSSMSEQTRRVVKSLLRKQKQHGWDAQTFLRHLLESLLPTPPASLPVRQARRLTIGSACSGWCAELWAAELLELDYHAVFGCDVLPVAEKICHALFQHDYWFGDCMEPEFMQAPSVDLFLGGLPCQAWSSAGLGLAFDDDRALLTFPIVRWLALRRPRVAIFEQVASILSRHPREFLFLLELLQNIKIRGRKAYNVSYESFNCRRHGWLPQNRERIFIVCVLREFATGMVQWPTEATRQIL